MSRIAVFALAAVLSASAVLGCERLLSEYTVEDGVVTVMVENSCTLNGFSFETKCCSPSGCVPAKLNRQDISLGPNGNAFTMAYKDFIYTIHGEVYGGSRMTGTAKTPLLVPESCHTGGEGDSSVPACSSTDSNFQVLVTLTPECPNDSDTIQINGMVNSGAPIDLATSRATMVKM